MSNPGGGLVDHALIYAGAFSESKMRFGIIKGRIQFYLCHHLGGVGQAAAVLFEKATDAVFRAMR
jgi:hypothetical protein